MNNFSETSDVLSGVSKIAGKVSKYFMFLYRRGKSLEFDSKVGVRVNIDFRRVERGLRVEYFNLLAVIQMM